MGAKLSDRLIVTDRHPGLCDGIRGLLETMFRVVVIVVDEAPLMECALR